MSLTISDELLAQTQFSAQELAVEFACFLYEKKRASSGQARKLAGLDQVSFQKELALRGIDLHYDADDFAQELKNLGLEL